MKKGEQAWNCYGNRTNRYLLVNYGFCYEDNLHESFHFDVRIDLNFNPDKPVGLNVILEQTNKLEKVQEIKLKRHLFNETLMSYIRTSMKADFFEHGKQDSKHILVTKAVDMKYE